MTPPTLKVAGSVAEALALDVLATLPADALGRWLATRRWYGAKSAAPRSVRVTHLVRLPWTEGDYAVARLAVETDGGVAQYQLPLAVVSEADDAIAAVESSAGRALLVDATADLRFRHRLADAFGHATDTAGRYGESFEGSPAGTRWVVEGIGEKALVVPAETAVALGKAEQSNTSLVIGEAAILKLFRRLEPGVHPDVELTRFLTVRAGYPNTPVLLGVIRFESRRGEMREELTAGMLQEFLPASVDAWSYALGRAAPYFAAPKTRELPNAFAADAERLGAVTRAMHEALSGEAADEAGPDFEPEPADEEDVARWAAATRRQIDDALALLERQLGAGGSLPAERQREARALLGRRAHFHHHLDELADALGDDAGFRIRHHGDFHLGQVLRTASGEFMIIDFEGEPARPLAERRRKHSALRDVAGMLRSFSYAAATLATEAGAKTEPSTREVRRGRWEKETRDAFLRGYLRGAGGGGRGEADEEEMDFLPEEPANVRRLLALFETEKVFYELAYELNNRPAWSWIPMRGIANLLYR